MGIPGLTPLLLMLGFLAPVLLTTPEPMCDQRVMNKYIQDVSKAESEIVELCRTSCNLPEPVMVLDTGVNIRSWRKMNRTRQASEVWRGQTLLSRAISQVQRHHSAMQPFVRQLEVMESCLRSIRNILRGHGAQVRAKHQICGEGVLVGEEAGAHCSESQNWKGTLNGHLVQPALLLASRQITALLLNSRWLLGREKRLCTCAQQRFVITETSREHAHWHFAHAQRKSSTPAGQYVQREREAVSSERMDEAQ
uniref:erythropoietin isoform X1 n=1 Tax=Podarcis muralis TaxID=64176 RepID=UPI00109F8ACB|nr:erythropoietin isoform X1 [Podarcis muralis]